MTGDTLFAIWAVGAVVVVAVCAFFAGWDGADHHPASYLIVGIGWPFILASIPFVAIYWLGTKCRRAAR